MTCDKEEELVCDECSRHLAEWEVDDFYWVPMCQNCVKNVRVSQVRQKLPANFNIKHIRGKHAKPCSDCGKTDWKLGDHYVYDMDSPWGTGKYCLECAELKDWNPESDEEVIGGVNVPVVHVPPSQDNKFSKRQRTT